MGNSRSIVGACCAAVLCQAAAWAAGSVGLPAIDPDAGLPEVTGLEARATVAVSPPESIGLSGAGECEEIGGFDRQFLATNRLRGNWYDFETPGLLTEIQMFLDLPSTTDLTFFVYRERTDERNVFDLLWTGVRPAGGQGPQFYASPPVGGGELQMEAGVSYVIGAGWGAVSVIFGRSDQGVGPFSRGEVRGIVGIDQAPPPPDPEGGFEFRDPFAAGAYSAQLCFAPDPGACCEGSDCTNGLNATECLDLGGDFAGPNTNCFEGLCPLLRAACCVRGECLDDLTQFQCENAEGGEFFAEMRCVQEPCSPRGACCTDGGCTEAVTERACVEDLGGIYRGDDVDCGDFPGCNAGACCLGDVCVRGMTEQACAGAGGSYKGPGSECDPGICDPLGACCLGDGTCRDSISPSSCAGLGGTYRGDNSECAGLDPACGLGACCSRFGCFDGETESDCTGSPTNGIWRGDGSTCETLDPHCQGSCCVNQDVCEEDVWTPERCEDLNGVFLGYGVACDPPPDDPCENVGSVDCCLPTSYTCVEAESVDVCGAIGGIVGCTECFECDENIDCDNGIFCDGAETCVGASCQSGTDPCPGQACREDTDDCVDCLSDSDCPGGQFCEPGNNACVECVVDGHCDDGNACTTDTCTANSCVHENVADGTDCSDGLFCNGDETCQTGACTGDQEPCVDRAHCDEEADVCLDCIRDSECSDGAFCNGVELCVAGLCGDGADPCEDNAHCDEDGDACFECLENAECDDGLFCNGAELCESNACVVDVPDPCVDQNHCDETDDACLECVLDSECRDDIFCNGRESCVDNACVTVPACEEGEMCDENGQRCGECFVDEDCTGDPGPCRKNDCTSDFICASIPDSDQNGDSCEDGEFCNGRETCNGGTCAGPDPCVDLDHCDEEADECLECIADSECSDGVFCNGVELCEDNVCNLDVDDACIDDDHCDEEGGFCLECLVDGECDDGLFCTGTETCVDNGCVTGQDPCEEGERCDDDDDMCVPQCGRDPVWICDGDVDGDGQVNPVDSGLIQAAFGSVDGQDLCNYDVDCDGQINPVDSGIVQSLFGTCDAPRAECP